MSPLRSGPYTLRIRDSNAPDDFVGGEYATAQAPNKTVVLQPQSAKGQVWNVIVEGEEKGSYIINLQASGLNGDDSDTYLHDESDDPRVPLFLSWKKLFKATHERDIGPTSIYSLVPTDVELIGATWYVGRNDKNEVALQPVPIVEGIPHPVWAFTPSHGD